jgi:hypothetical protein
MKKKFQTFLSTFRYEHSNEVTDIITAVPPWILRWGILFILSTLGLIMVFGSFIKYPLIVKAKIKINKNLEARFTLPQSSFTKLKPGSRVIIELDRYPSNEYGTLQGSLASISDSAFQDSLITGEISLDKAAIYKYSRSAKLQNGLLGSADIVAEESTLLKRLLQKFRPLTLN